VKITGPKYWIAGTLEGRWWSSLHFGFVPEGGVVSTGQPDVQSWDDEAEYLVTLRSALASSDHPDREALGCPYEATILAVLRQRSGIVLSEDDMRIVWKHDYERMD